MITYYVSVYFWSTIGKKTGTATQLFKLLFVLYMHEQHFLVTSHTKVLCIPYICFLLEVVPEMIETCRKY